MLIIKTGSTNGFSTYVVFVRAGKVGGGVLANKRYPNEARVTLANEVLEHSKATRRNKSVTLRARPRVRYDRTP